jgi:hypothetical protein
VHLTALPQDGGAPHRLAAGRRCTPLQPGPNPAENPSKKAGQKPAEIRQKSRQKSRQKMTENGRKWQKKTQGELREKLAIIGPKRPSQGYFADFIIHLSFTEIRPQADLAWWGTAVQLRWRSVGALLQNLIQEVRDA